MPVQLSFEHRDPELKATALKAEARRILAAVDRPKAELSILVVDDPRMRELNRDWRGIDRTTDVLSFPQDTPEGLEIDVLGDIVLSAPTARRNASRYKRTFGQEIRRLMVHGVLHLLGHDHKKKAEAERMRAEERRVLSALKAADGPG